MRALLLAVLFTGGCCWSWPPWSCSEPPQPVCHHEEVLDAGFDATNVDAPPDAPDEPDAAARPPEPGIESCVASWTGDNCSNVDSAYEPNNGMVMATYLKQCTNDGLQGSTGPYDVDVYRTGDCNYGTFVATGPLMPWAQVDVGAVRVCVFPTCATGATNVYACIETDLGVQATDGMPSMPADLWNNDVGFRGCCRVGPGRITAQADCPRRSTTIDTYLWIEPTDHQDSNCHDYTLIYSATK